MQVLTTARPPPHSAAAVGGETAGSRCRPSSCCPSPLPLPLSGVAADTAEYLPRAWVAPPACGWHSALICGASAQITSAFGVELGSCWIGRRAGGGTSGSGNALGSCWTGRRAPTSTTDDGEDSPTAKCDSSIDGLEVKRELERHCPRAAIRSAAGLSACSPAALVCDSLCTVPWRCSPLSSPPARCSSWPSSCCSSSVVRRRATLLPSRVTATAAAKIG